MDKNIPVTKSSMPSIKEYMDEISGLWESKWLTNRGEIHKKLENELLNYLKAEHIVLFTNGHLALETVLKSMNLKGEVITTPFTFASTTHAIVNAGLTPVFCDIDPTSLTIDVDKIEDLITDETVAILPVHVYGHICDVERLDEISKKYNLKLIYDAAHTFGEEYNNRGIGTFGDASMFSFHATKVFNTIEGGAVTFNDKDLGDKMRVLQNFGISGTESIIAIGGNAKMNEFQAAMGICNLRYIESNIKKRKRVVERYRENLKDIPGITIFNEKSSVKSNYSYFPVVFKGYHKTRDVIFEQLNENGIYARKYFYPLITDFECYSSIYSSLETPIALDVSVNILTLPLYADLELEDVDRICNIIKSEGEF